MVFFSVRERIDGFYYFISCVCVRIALIVDGGIDVVIATIETQRRLIDLIVNESMASEAMTSSKLSYVNGIPCGVLVVGSDRHGQQVRESILARQSRVQIQEQCLPGSILIDVDPLRQRDVQSLLQKCLQRLDRLPFDLGRVHARLIELACLLLSVENRRRLVRHSLFEDTLQNNEIPAS